MTENRQQLLEALNRKKSDYRMAVRWYKDTISYKRLVSGDTWKDDGNWLITDAQTALREAIDDIQRYRKAINSLRKRIGLLGEQ